VLKIGIVVSKEKKSQQQRKNQAELKRFSHNSTQSESERDTNIILYMSLVFRVQTNTRTPLFSQQTLFKMSIKQIPHKTSAAIATKQLIQPPTTTTTTTTHNMKKLYSSFSRINHQSLQPPKMRHSIPKTQLSSSLSSSCFLHSNALLHRNYSTTKQTSLKQTDDPHHHHHHHPMKPTIEQQKSASLEYTTMVRSTTRLLSSPTTATTTNMTPAQSLELKRLLSYWSSRFYTTHVLYTLFAKKGGNKEEIYQEGCNYVFQLLDYVQQCKEEEEEEVYLSGLSLGCFMPCSMNVHLTPSFFSTTKQQLKDEMRRSGSGRDDSSSLTRGAVALPTLGAVVQRTVHVPTYVSCLSISRRALQQLYKTQEESESGGGLWRMMAEIEYLGRKVQLLLALSESGAQGESYVKVIPKEMLSIPELDYMSSSMSPSSSTSSSSSYKEDNVQEACLIQMKHLLQQMEALPPSSSFNEEETEQIQSTYNTYLSTLCRLGYTTEADELLCRMEYTHDVKKTGEEEDVKMQMTKAFPNVACYNAVMHGYASTNFATTKTKTNAPPVPITTPTASTQITASSSSSSSRSSSSTTRSLLSRLETRYYKSNYDESLKPDAISYGIVLHSLASLGYAQEAEDVLDKMEDVWKNGDHHDGFVRPNTICYNTVIGAYARSRQPNAANRAESLLRRMERIHKSKLNPDVTPDTVSYGSVISAWARSGGDDIDSAKKAEAWLHYSMDLYKKTGNNNIKPDSISFNAVLDAWAKQSGKRKSSRSDTSGLFAAEKAEKLLLQMQELRDAGDSNIRPCTISYNTVIDAIAKAGNNDNDDGDNGSKAGERAERLLRRMQNLYKDGNVDVKPDTITYNSVLDAWVSTKKFEGSVYTSPKDEEDRRYAIQSAERILREMEDVYEKEGKAGGVIPDVISYNILMDAFGKSEEDGSAERAEEILRSMEEKYASGHYDHLRPSNISFNICINAYAKSGESGAASRAESLIKRMIELTDRAKENNEDSSSVQPCTISFTSVIDAISKSGESGAAVRAESLLHDMQVSNHARPNTVTFNTVINALSQSGEKGAAERAEAILRQMEEMRQSGDMYVAPDTVTFSSVINAWARSGEDGAAERAEAILRKMGEHSTGKNNVNVKPNTITYSAVINAWAKSKQPDAADRALAVLHWMEDLYESGDRDAQPNTFCYNAVINALAKSESADKAQRSYDVLQHMMSAHLKGNRYARPNVMTYSTILNACAYTQGTHEEKSLAFKIARLCFKELMQSKYDKPNNVTFAMFLQCVSRLAPRGDSRDLLASSVFQECCSLGQVDDAVLRSYRGAVSPRTYWDSFGTILNPNQQLTLSVLPAEWSSNVKRRKRNNYQTRR